MSKIEEMVKEEKDKLLEDVQEAIVNAGGRFFRKKELEYIPLGELLTTCVLNSIEFSVKYKRRRAMK